MPRLDALKDVIRQVEEGDTVRVTYLKSVGHIWTDETDEDVVSGDVTYARVTDNYGTETAELRFRDGFRRYTVTVDEVNPNHASLFVRNTKPKRDNWCISTDGAVDVTTA